MKRFTVFIHFLLAMLYITKTAASPSCVDSCFGVKNGYYQYCLNCHQYVTCVYGIMYIRPCPEDLVWDDDAKKCVWTSTTCKAKSGRFPLEVKAASGCVDSCFGVLNGEYQYCLDCHQYVACAYGYKFIMPCPEHLVWDDVLKKCDWESSTCEARPKSKRITSEIEDPKGCVNSCDGVKNGHYQYCPDCRQYVSCVYGNTYILPCSSDKLWDDNEKRCVRISFTCAALGTDNHD